MSTEISGLSSLTPALQAKLAKIDYTDGISDEEKIAAGLTDADIADIKEAGLLGEDTTPTVDDGSEELTKLEEQKTTIEAEIETLKGEKTELENLKKEQEAKLKDYQTTYEIDTKTLERLEETFEEKKERLDELNKEIAETAAEEEQKTKDTMSDITQKALAEYDPEDGISFEKYLDKMIANANIGDFSALDSANNEAVALSADINDLLSVIKTAASVVLTDKNLIETTSNLISGYNKSIEAKDKEIATKNTELSGIEEKISIQKKEIAKASGDPGADLTPDEIWALVSPEEKALIDGLDIDIYEKMSDGEARYIFAPGQDGNYHVYDMGQYGTAEDNSLVRLTLGYSAESFNIIPSGSGGIVWRGDDFKKLGDDASGGKRIYSLNDCESACSSKACYSTWSPLSFDVNGDGVKTSSQTVKYDIDGDGELDIVNNSDDWVLAFDKDHDGIAGKDGSELFGDNTDIDGDGVKDGYANGFDALRAMAEKAGLIGEGDDVLDTDDLKKLEEEFGLVMTKGYGGESKSLSDLGITEINLSKSDTKLIKNFDGQNNDLMTQDGATFKVNGETREYADIWNSKKDADSVIDTAVDLNFDFTEGLELIDKANSLESVKAEEKSVDADDIVEEEKSAATTSYKEPEPKEDENKDKNEDDEDNTLSWFKRYKK